eukprot:g756.t1
MELPKTSPLHAKWDHQKQNAFADAALKPRREVPAHCELAVIGAGWSGAYYAWRMAVDTSTVAAENICVFEANGRVGGRVYSVHNLPYFRDMSLDVGGYRFIENNHLPGDLVWDALKIRTECYDFGCRAGCSGNMPCYIIKDAYGNNFGFGFPIEAMLSQIEASARGQQQVFFGKELIGLYAAPTKSKKKNGHVELQFRDGTKVTASSVMINMPRNALDGLSPDSLTNTANPNKNLQDSVTVSGQNKVYIYYEDAWWANKLGLMEGNFNSNWGRVPLAGRYHDGPLKCQTGVDTAGEPVFSGEKVAFGNCTGAMLVYYSSNTPYYRDLMRSDTQPLTVVTDQDTNSSAHAALKEIHDTLMDYHAAIFEEAGISAADIAEPKMLAVSNWISGGEYTPGIGRFTGSADDRATMRKPLPEYNVYVANQDYGFRSGWAVGGLAMSEKILQAEIGLAKPSWLNGSWYEEHILAVP